MKYTLHTLKADYIIELFDLIPDSIFHALIGKHDKYFKKNKSFSGFRVNKAPRKLIYKVFADEIYSKSNIMIEKDLIDILKVNIKETNIEEILSTFTQDIFSISYELEKEILLSGLTISPSLLLLVSNHNISEIEKLTIDKYHTLYLENKKCLTEKVKLEAKEVSNDKFKKIIKENDKNKEILEYERKEVQSLKKEIVSLKGDIDALNLDIEVINKSIQIKDNEINTLTKKNTNNKEKITNYKKDIQDLTTQVKEAIKLKSENVKLNNIIEELKDSVLSPNTILEICSEIIDDLKGTAIDDKQLLFKSKEWFNENQSVIEAWEIMTAKENEMIKNIVSKMESNNIKNNDIEEVENIENCIYMKYMILKSLIVVFYKYLEQGVSNKSIGKMFDKK